MSSCTFGDSSKIDRYYGDGLKIFCELGPNCVCQPPAGHPVPVPDNGQCCMLILTEDHPRTWRHIRGALGALRLVEESRRRRPSAHSFVEVIREMGMTCMRREEEHL